MSAFIIGNEHISAMLQHTAPRYPGDGARYYWNGEPYYFNGNLQEVGQKLVDENHRSVNYRYSENEVPHSFRFAAQRSFTPVEIVKLCDCYNYQTCETPDWEDSEAYAIVQAIRERAIKNLVGYDKAPWAYKC